MTPVLAMTVVREAAIAAFVPEKFYTVALTLADGGTASSKRFAQKEDAELLLSKCRKEGRVTVQKMERKEKAESPPQLYDLTACLLYTSPGPPSNLSPCSGCLRMALAG